MESQQLRAGTRAPATEVTSVNAKKPKAESLTAGVSERRFITEGKNPARAKTAVFWLVTRVAR